MTIRIARGRLSALLGCVLFAAALTGCGGGGGDAPDPAHPTVSLTPIRAVEGAGDTYVTYGQSATLLVPGQVLDRNAFSGTVYAVVVDEKGLLSGRVEISSIGSSGAFSAYLYTSPTAKPGRYTGSFEVRLCRDATCSSQFAGSPVMLPYDILVHPRPLDTSLSASSISVRQGVTPPTLTLTAPLAANQTWTAESSVPWMKVGTPSGQGNITSTLQFDLTSLAVGKYQALLTVKASDNSGRTLSISVDVRPTGFSFSNREATFNAVNGAPIPAQVIALDLENRSGGTWQAVADKPWLTVTPTSGTTPAQISLQPDPYTTPMASGAYLSTVRLSSPGADGGFLSVNFTLTPATLTLGASSMTLGGALGREPLTGSTAISLDTGTNAWPYTVSGLPAALNPLSGQVGGGGATLQFAPSATPPTAGTTNTTAVVTAKVNGQTLTRSLPMTLNVDRRKLLLSRWGLGLASTPLGRVLSRTVTVSTNYGGSVDWTASSDATWLTPTMSGETLTLTANPAALPNETISYANVTVSSPSAGVMPATLRIALWKSATGAVTRSIAASYQRLAADPIRPWIYAQRGSSLEVINAHTGVVVNTVPFPNARWGGMAATPDGGKLVVIDNQASPDKQIKVLRLPDLVPLATFKASDTSTDEVVVGRVAGRDVVWSGHTPYTLDEDGTVTTQARMSGATIGTMQAVSPDGRLASGLDYFLAAPDYSDIQGGMLLTGPATRLPSLGMGTFARDVAFSPDGSRLYFAAISGSSNACLFTTSTSTGMRVNHLSSNEANATNVEVTWDGRVVCGGDSFNAGNSAYDFWLYAASGAPGPRFKVTGSGSTLLARQLVVSADGGIVVVPTTDPKLAIVPIGY